MFEIQIKFKGETNLAQYFCCPKCGSKHLQAVTTTDTNVQTQGGGYSGGKGCLGYLMFGWLGLLCGACGSKQKTTVQTTTKTTWTCTDCGNRFMHPDDMRAGIEGEKMKAKITLGVTVFFGIGFVIDLILAVVSASSFSFFMSSGKLAMYWGMVAFSAIATGIMYLLHKAVQNVIAAKEQELRDMEAAMEQFRVQALKDEMKNDANDFR